MTTALTTPVPGDDPCGADVQWDPAMMRLDQMMTAAIAQDEAVVDGDRVTSGSPTFEEIRRMAEELCTRTKDVRVLAIFAEACWHDRGLASFAEAMETLVVVAETWPDPDSGVYPRADADDGDLSIRAAPLGKLLYRVPSLAQTVGWGGERPESPHRRTTGTLLRGVFEAWQTRLEPAFGPRLPVRRDAWAALQPFVAEAGGAPEQEAAPDVVAGDGSDAPVSVALPEAADPWDLIDRAAMRMTVVDRHSPALPILRLLASWRDVGIIEIADAMKASGLSLEQLLESIKAQTEANS